MIHRTRCFHSIHHGVSHPRRTMRILLIRRPKDFFPFLTDYKAIMGTSSYSYHYFVTTMYYFSEVYLFYCVFVCPSSREGSDGFSFKLCCEGSRYSHLIRVIHYYIAFNYFSFASREYLGYLL